MNFWWFINFSLNCELVGFANLSYLVTVCQTSRGGCVGDLTTDHGCCLGGKLEAGAVFFHSRTE
jgi:hypothetical protein